MMNILAIILVATSLAFAGVWSPPAAQKHQLAVDRDESEVIVKDGHRVVVVEYDEKVQADGAGNTKVSISPPHENVDRAADHSKSVENSGGGVKEVVCDAFGKCKHVVQSVVGGGRRKVGDGVDEVEEKVRDLGDKAAEKVGEVKEGVKRAVVGGKDEVFERTHQGAEMAKEGARKGADKVKEAVHKVRKGVDKGKEAVHDVYETVTSIGEKVKGKVKGGVGVAEDAMDNLAEKAKAGAEKVKEEGKQELREIYDLGRQLLQHIWSYLAWGRTLDAVSGLVHLIGFCIAYGMAVWVTFVSSNVLSRALSRQQFGVLQSKIYPVYFRAMEYSLGLSLLGHLLGRRAMLWSEKADRFQGYNLAFALGMVMINLYYLEPRASKVMYERMREEKEEGRGRDPYSIPDSAKAATTEPVATSHPSVTSQQDKSISNDKSQDRIVLLSQKLKKLNSQSSLVNILSLMSLTWHLVYLSQQVNGCR